MKLVDVSSNNHPGRSGIDWKAAAAAGIGGAYVKATEGTGYVNDWWPQDAAGARAAGLVVGLYHFARPGVSGPVEQADKLLSVTGGFSGDLPLVLDLEDGAGSGWAAVNTWGRAFCDRLLSGGHDVALYANRNYLVNMPGAPWGRRLWLADPRHRPGVVCWLWQYGQEAVPGIAGAVDVNQLMDDTAFTPVTPKGRLVLNAPIVGPPILNPVGPGYWLVAADGGVFAFGGAAVITDPLPADHLNQPVTGGCATPSGKGLYLTAGDGGVFALGDAVPLGDIPSLSK